MPVMGPPGAPGRWFVDVLVGSPRQWVVERGVAQHVVERVRCGQSPGLVLDDDRELDLPVQAGLVRRHRDRGAFDDERLLPAAEDHRELRHVDVVLDLLAVAHVVDPDVEDPRGL